MSTKPISSFHGKYGFLSNFYVCRVDYEGKTYKSSEHAFQAAKSLDPKIRDLVANQATPGLAKAAGHMIRLRPLWDETKVQIMKQILQSKFQNEDLAGKLIATGDALLVEGNRHDDRFWGVVYIGDKWVGENWLGKLLMEVREELA